MPGRSHHKSHASEYAALKARANAAGMSVRAFKSARKSDPTTHYTPRAQKSLTRRGAAIAAATAINADRAPWVPADTLTERAEARVRRASAKQLDAFVNIWQAAPDPDDFWDSFDDYDFGDVDSDDILPILYYRG